MASIAWIAEMTDTSCSTERLPKITATRRFRLCSLIEPPRRQETEYRRQEASLLLPSFVPQDRPVSCLLSPRQEVADDRGEPAEVVGVGEVAGAWEDDQAGVRDQPLHQLAVRHWRGVVEL